MSSVLATELLYGLLRTLGLSLLRNRGLAAKDILLDLAGGCFRQLGNKLDSLGTLEVCQMITSVIAQLGFGRGRACFQDDKCEGRLAPALIRHSYDCHLLNSWMSLQGGFDFH